MADDGVGKSADDLLREMVSQGKKPGESAASKQNGAGRAGGPAVSNQETPALPAPKHNDMAIMTINSDSDGETAPKAPAAKATGGGKEKKDKKDKKEKKEKKEAKSSSSSSDSSDADEPKKKRRINAFSSLRNVEKEKAAVRKCRAAGAAAALNMVKSISDNPYFAP
eukprot:TRINITY_DN111994_c0_g1_i1.p1 TRINITY_DN111994_c0_g1~~TRINITY_DN111994_c0_g1_i1.p1  ORF type:complete len:167 (-),score=52.21 TRINITY_DN111994_c0_g1_i1:49-549(-)